MENMFSGASNLIEVNVSGLNTSSVKTTRSMFLACSNLVNIKGLGQLDFQKVESLQEMFKMCYKLTTNDCNWQINNLKNAISTFESCRNINYLKLTN